MHDEFEDKIFSHIKTGYLLIEMPTDVSVPAYVFWIARFLLSKIEDGSLFRRLRLETHTRRTQQVHCGKPSDLYAAIQGDVCLFCIKMFVLLVIEHSCEEILLELHQKIAHMEDLRMNKDSTELRDLQDSINRLNRDLKLMYSSTFSFVDFNSQTNMSVQDKRLTQLAYKILNLLSLNGITGSEREEITAKLSLAQIMRTLERRKREGKTISGIELATMYRMKRLQRTRIEQERDDESTNDDRMEQERPRRLFQELVPPSRLEFTSQEHKQI